MDKRISGIGLVLLFAGILLIVAFWPLLGVNANNINREEDSGEFSPYKVGDKVKVYGTITEVSVNDFPSDLEDIGVEDSVLIELNGNLWILIEDKNSIEFNEGDTVYCEIGLKDVGPDPISSQYWELTAESRLKSKTNLNYIFYIIAGLGIGISAVGFVKE